MSATHPDLSPVHFKNQLCYIRCNSPVRSFGELLSQYIERVGISDAELARRLGVSRQTVFRWREGLTDRPRHRDDVQDLARKLRLSSSERDELLLAAGFSPEGQRSDPRTSTLYQDGTETPETARGEPLQVLEVEDSRLGAGYRSIPDRLARRPRWLLAGAGGVVLVLLLLLISIADRIGFSSNGDIMSAVPGETLVVISPFANFGGGQAGFNVAGRLEETLAEEFETLGLETARVGVLQEPILDESAARAAGERLGAQLVVWGEYDSGRVIAVVSPIDEITSEERRWLLPTADELNSTINADLPSEVRWLAVYILGQSHLRAGRYNEAETALNRALTFQPSETDSLSGVYFHLALLESQRAPSDLNDIVAYYTEVLELSPGHLSAMNNRAVAYLERRTSGDLERAETDLRAALGFVPDNPVYQMNLALAIARKGPDELEEVLDLLERAASQRPGSASLQNSLCWYYALAENPEEALPHCDVAVELDPSGSSNDSRGVALTQLGRSAEAIQDFEFYLERLQAEDPEHYDRFATTRMQWISALQEGQNPFDEATLHGLLNE